MQKKDCPELCLKQLAAGVFGEKKSNSPFREGKLSRPRKHAKRIEGKAGSKKQKRNRAEGIRLCRA